MASSLLRLTRSVVPFRPAAVSASHRPIIRQHFQNTRSFSSPADNMVPYSTVPFDLSYLTTQMEIMSGVPSISFTIVKGEELIVNVPGVEKTVTDGGPCVSVHMPGIQKGEIQADGFQTVIEDDKLLIRVKTDEEIYLAGMKLPLNFDRNGSFKVAYESETLKLTLPMLENSDYVMHDFIDTAEKMKIVRPTPYCVMFDRADIGQKMCGLIANRLVKGKSFTLYKKDTCERIYMKRNMPGVETMTVTKEGLCVSLSMTGLQIDDVDAVFEYETLIIEGKRGNEHYIAWVRVPEGFHKEHHMIKREMEDGVYKATGACSVSMVASCICSNGSSKCKKQGIGD